MEVKITACSPKLKVADCLYNVGQIYEEVKKATKEGCQVVLFPELSITSCSCGSLFHYSVLLEAALAALNYLLDITSTLDIYIVVGLPIKHKQKIHNCAAILHFGEVIAYIPKLFSKSTGIFSDYIYDSEDNITPDFIFSVNDVDFKIAIGDDVESIIDSNVVILNPSSVPVVAGEYEKIKNSLLSISSGRGIISVNPSYCESTSFSVYGGTALAILNGSVVVERKPFEKKDMYFSISGNYERKEIEVATSSVAITKKNPFIPIDNTYEYFKEILMIQAHALAKRIEHTRSKMMVIGISGGLDSTLTLLACYFAALVLKREPKECIKALSLPALGSSSRTKSNAEKLCEELKVDFSVIDISEAVKSHLHDIGHDGITTDAAYENSQARERTQILMDICNMVNGIMIGSGDLSELALGFTTYGGDQMSMYSINASIPKTLVKALVIHCGDRFGGSIKSILYDIADTPISPELLPPIENVISQKTEDIIGPYELHDFFIYYMIHELMSPREIFSLALSVFSDSYSSEEILRWLEVFYTRFFMSQFKRVSLPDSPRITKISLSDFSMPSDASGIEWLNEVKNIHEEEIE